MKRTIAFLLFVILLASCSSSAVTSTITSTETAIATATVEPTISPTSIPTIQVDGLSVPDPHITNPELFDIYSNSPIVQYANATGQKQTDVLAGVKTPTVVQESNGSQYVLIESQDGTPLFIAQKDINGNWGWSEATLGNIGKLNGMNIGIDYGHVNEYGVRQDASKFNTTFVSYDLGWKFTEKVQGTTIFSDPADYADADQQVDYAIKHNQTVIGGGIIYWNDYPDWLKTGIKNGQFTKDQVQEFVKNRITTHMQHYGDKILIWVVVNEFHPISQGWHPDELQNILGDYTEFAFQIARAENPNAILLLNDNGNETPELASYKSDMERAKSLHDKGLIDGMGLQMHVLMFDNHIPTYRELLTTFNNYKAMNIPVYLTEFDVNLQNIKGTDVELTAAGIDPKTVSSDMDKRMLVQAKIFSDVVKAAIDSGDVKLISFFSIGDKFSWLKESFDWQNADSTLFDNGLRPKIAYYAVLQALLEKGK